MGRPRHISIAAVVLCLSACDRSPEDLRPLVGDGSLPIVMPGPTETVRVTLVHYYDRGSRNLDVILTPDQKLLARRYSERWQGEHKSIVATEMEETVGLSNEAAADLRRRLAVFRPAQLSRDGPFVMPRHCGFTFHGASRAVVEFQDNKGGAGLFILQANCDNANAEKLADGLRDAIASLPGIKTAANFRW